MRTFREWEKECNDKVHCMMVMYKIWTLVHVSNTSNAYLSD